MCLLSKFFQHFLEGENLYELDLKNYNDIDGNSYSLTSSLSSNWKGTCDLIEKLNYFKNNYTNTLSILNTTLETSSCSSDTLCHKNTMNNFETTSNLIEKLDTINSISSARPSGNSTQLTPNFELEFQNRSDLNSMGGIIFNNYINNLVADISDLEIIQLGATAYINYYEITNELNDEYKNIMNFDKTVSSAASIIMTNYINDKKLILNFFQFMFIFIFTGYLGTLTCIIIFLIIYQLEKYRCLYYFLIGFINLFVIFALWAIVLSALFQGIRLFVRESPRVMKFLFTEDYILNGNTDAYPPKFGYQDQTQINFFDICLNGNGDLLSNYLNKNKLIDILTVTQNILGLSHNLYSNINTDIKNSNLIKNSYDILNNESYLYSSIIKLEEIKNNLYLASEGFENDDIREIINNIRTNLDNTACQMTFEYYVIKKSDCPRYSIILTEITNTVENIYHCYVIQDLVSGTRAQYTGTTCNNDYINNAIAFIKEIDSMLNNRINSLKEIQTNYVLTYNSMQAEINQINSTFTKIADLLKDKINNNYPKANCSSLKFDLIDFCEYMYDKIGYKLKIMIIFSCLSGMLGYIVLYFILLILNKINENIYYSQQKNYTPSIQGYNPFYQKRDIKPMYYPQNKTDDEKFNYKYKNTLLGNGIKKQNTKRKLTKDENRINNNNIKGNVVYNNVRKMEMKTFKNNEQ